MPNGKVEVGIIGSQFQADIHAASFQIMPEEAEVVAVASATPGHAEELARKYTIPPLHAAMTARAGKHVVCEKPLCMTLDGAGEMIDIYRRQGVLLLYAEELLFTPKYVKAKEMADHGAFGKLYLIEQSEKHFSPHSPWFWDADRSGGGAAFGDLDDCAVARHKLEEFRACWAAEVDAKGQEQVWREYLARARSR